MNDLQLITEKEAARILAVSPGTLRVRRCTGKRPDERSGLAKIPYIKEGRMVRYRLKDIEAYVNGNLRGTECAITPSSLVAV